VELAATDLDVAVVYRPAGLSVEGEGVAVVPARYLLDLVRHMEGEFVLEAGEKEAELRCGRGVYRLNAYDPSSYPEVKGPEDGLVAEVEFEFLRKVSGRVGVACAKDLSRPALTGVLWETSPEGLTLVATDGTRLAVWQVSEVLPDVRRVVVPGRGLDLVAAMPAPPEGEKVAVRLGSSQIWFESSAWAVSSRLLASPYPEWRQVAPRVFVASFRVSLPAFVGALRRAAVVSEAGSGLPAVQLSVRPGVVEVDASSASVGRAHEELEAEVEGSPLEVAFNADLLFDGLGALEGEQVLFRLAGSQSVSELSDPADGSYRYLALPLRL
jgi:DNA polymerase-3 subunit beta